MKRREARSAARCSWASFSVARRFAPAWRNHSMHSLGTTDICKTSIRDRIDGHGAEVIYERPPHEMAVHMVQPAVLIAMRCGERRATAVNGCDRAGKCSARFGAHRDADGPGEGWRGARSLGSKTGEYAALADTAAAGDRAVASEPTDNIQVQASPEAPAEEPIPFGFAAIYWGARHPTQFWRLFLSVLH